MWCQEDPAGNLNIYNMLTVMVLWHCATLLHLTAEEIGAAFPLPLATQLNSKVPLQASKSGVWFKMTM